VDRRRARCQPDIAFIFDKEHGAGIGGKYVGAAHTDISFKILLPEQRPGGSHQRRDVIRR
jgi:hypothetical protein